ncbi:MAG: chemotaxis-specific protein-glutamate methyltransferase CheB [Deltaproteobacteria bacterium]|nr:chemotaxis-specific protein-glutamate methyltransferase CheB [Deltaproteobacteria bacterium]
MPDPRSLTPDPRPPIPDPRSPIRVLIVDDSPVVRELLAYILNSDPGIRVIGTAGNGEEALKAIQHEKPDVITMDIIMPKMDGFETTRTIMETNPIPIIIVTGSFNIREVGISFKATEVGALTIIQKPRGIGHPSHAKDARELIRMVKLMSEVKVIRRWPDKHRKTPALRRVIENGEKIDEIKLVAIGASTGGPPVIRQILSGLPKSFPWPVLIVQHIAEGFIDGFADWLNQSSSLPIHLAAHNAQPMAGHAYLAPDGRQMQVVMNGRIALIDDPPENGLRPSVSYLFRSVAHVYGRQAVGILLTGMGKDGAAELKLMREKGAVTIVQDQESSTVFGMPGEAVRLDAARYILSPEEIVSLLGNLINEISVFFGGLYGREKTYRGNST